MTKAPSKPLIYIASPYTKGDVAINVRAQLETFELLSDLGCYPVAPLWAHFQHLYWPHPYDFWVDYSLRIARTCDACFRRPAFGPKGYFENTSAGADAEVQLFRDLGRPVFYYFDEVREWLTSLNKET
jgi:hypothetical protein